VNAEPSEIAKRHARFPVESTPGAASSLVALVSRHRVAVTMLFLAAVPLLLPYHALAVNILIFGLFTIGFNLVYGYAGMLSFGHAALFGAGAYGCGIALVQLGLSWWTAIVCGTVLATALAALIGALAMRTRGIYFSMVTLALAQCVYYIFYQAASLTGGENGLRGINVEKVSLLGIEVNLLHPLVKYYVVLIFVGAALWLMSRVLGSAFGAAMEAVRENESRARACGFNVQATRVLAFTLSGAFCGLAGALNAIHLSTVAIDSLHYHMSGQVLMMALLGGSGTFFGPLAGAAAFLLIEHLVTAITVHWQLVVGLIFVLLVLFLPRGIWGTLLARLER
jgi:branched-chain amino acid transport system permease protein